MKIALGVSGGIACYKAAEILRRLQDRGFEVAVVMTKGAAQFVTPLTFRALSGNKVYMDIFEGASAGSDPASAYDHIFLAQGIDLFLIAPATADCIAKMAAGMADDFLTTFHLAVQSPIVVAPAMNTRRLLTRPTPSQGWLVFCRPCRRQRPQAALPAGCCSHCG